MLKPMQTEHTRNALNVGSEQDDDASKPTSQTGTEAGSRSVSHSPVVRLARYFNPLVLKFAGTRLLPLYGVIEHRGRISGKLYHTPVVVRATGYGFTVPMPWGEGTDWYRNVKAAGECVIRWKGRNYEMVQPELMAPDAAHRSFSAIERVFIARFRINRFLHLRHRV